MAADGGRMGRMRILVVDDDRSVRDALRRALTLAGYEVQMAEGGQQALTQVASGVPEAVVLDIGMPDIDGHEVCARIRSQPWGGSVMLIAVSGWGQESDRRRSARAGFNMHLVKPVDPDALLRIVREVMSQNA